MKSSTERFSDRVADYIKYRPHYPLELIHQLKKLIHFNRDWVVADIGSGTGNSCLPFLKNDNRTIGVEPNDAMREGSESVLSNYNKFISINGTAENTTLPESSIDLIFCGQAFHWFDKKSAKQEFERILKPKGHMVLCWNQRDEESEFQKKYETVLKECIEDYGKVNHRNISTEEIGTFFLPKKLKTASFKNHQDFDLTSLKGRLLSSSYCPNSGKAYEELMGKIENLFNEFEVNGTIKFEYKTNIYFS